MKLDKVNQFVILYLIQDLVPRSQDAIEASKSLESVDIEYALKKDELLNFVFEKDIIEEEKTPVEWGLLGHHILKRTEFFVGLVTAMECFKKGEHIAAMNVLIQHQCAPKMLQAMLPIMIKLEDEKTVAKKTLKAVVKRGLDLDNLLPEIQEYFKEVLEVDEDELKNSEEKK